MPAPVKVPLGFAGAARHREDTPRATKPCTTFFTAAEKVGGGGTGTNPTAAGAGRANVYPKPLLTTPYSAGALWMPVKLHAYLHP